jgi:hypothetical protein
MTLYESSFSATWVDHRASAEEKEFKYANSPQIIRDGDIDNKLMDISIDLVLHPLCFAIMSIPYN